MLSTNKITDKELFLKYNFIDTAGLTKEKILKNNYFFNKNDFINNFNIPQQKWVFLIHGTYNCNTNCIYCENQYLRKQYNNAIMDKNILLQIIPKLGANIQGIVWHGGEPLLLPEEYFIIISQAIKKFNYDIKVSLQTNGILLTPEKQKFLEELDIKWGTSFDGLMNDITRGSQSTKQVLEVLKRNPNHGMIAVTIDNSINELIKNYNYFKSLGITLIQQSFVHETVGIKQDNYLISNKIAVDKIIEYLNYWIHDTENPVADSFLTRNIRRLLGKNQICENLLCVGKWINIDPFGNIGTCGTINKEDNFGNINFIHDYTDILSNPNYINKINQQKELILSHCINCQYLSTCYGGCMELNYGEDKNYKKINERNCHFQQLLLNNIYEVIKDIDITQTDKYNPMFLKILKENNYFSLTEIKNIENSQVIYIL